MNTSSKNASRGNCRVAKMQKLGAALLAAGVLACGAGAARAQTSYGLSSCFMDEGSATLSAVMSRANTQAQNGPKFPSASVDDHWVFEGNFKPRSSQTKLAIFADDGANVSRAELDANGNPTNWAPVNATLGVGQALPNLAQSFQVMNESWNTSKTYRIKIEYKNLYYVPTQTTPDVDGLTLFAFNGGGTVSDNGDPPAPDYAWIDHLEYSVDGVSWDPVDGTLGVQVGTQISFRVVKTGEVWRDGKPSWGGSSGATGIGESTSVTFNTAGDFGVVADDGSSSVQIAFVSVEEQNGTCPVD